MKPTCKKSLKYLDQSYSIPLKTSINKMSFVRVIVPDELLGQDLLLEIEDRKE